MIHKRLLSVDRDILDATKQTLETWFSPKNKTLLEVTCPLIYSEIFWCLDAKKPQHWQFSKTKMMNSEVTPSVSQSSVIIPPSDAVCLVICVEGDYL